uniref:ATP synthase F0 subunit 8 n=1 Tax=Dendropoma gregarium TaxID=169306 RepID=E2FLQ6_9CAEN|nr:ATP synthase F0 subunit 8 [Dendropoma gregarium]ADI79372.1 ATP synthase F0 subunit 8 [Dendropoma gregarium]
MPQLAPLSWFWLYLLFWTLFLALCMSAWWWDRGRLSCPPVKKTSHCRWSWC